jgi:hypothetical protein
VNENNVLVQSASQKIQFILFDVFHHISKVYLADWRRWRFEIWTCGCECSVVFLGICQNTNILRFFKTIDRFLILFYSASVSGETTYNTCVYQYIKYIIIHVRQHTWHTMIFNRKHTHYIEFVLIYFAIKHKLTLQILYHWQHFHGTVLDINPSMECPSNCRPTRWQI